MKINKKVNKLIRNQKLNLMIINKLSQQLQMEKMILYK